jgi:hypothetical protein
VARGAEARALRHRGRAGAVIARYRRVTKNRATSSVALYETRITVKPSVK